jgi:methionyl-tRNA synthetase
MPKSFFITTAISYPNGVPHIGHAYEAITTDAIARFEQLDGKDVFFLTGTDEHGLKMKQTAAKAGMTPRALADQNSARFKDMVAALGLSNNDFIRTTEDRHYKACQELWHRMEANGDIYLKKYAGWYSVRDESYYAEDETKLNEEGVRVGGQGTPVEWTEEETFFFRLSKYQDALLAHYDQHPEFILPPERRNEAISFVKGGLEDLSISRTTLDWGIPVPGHPGHVMYVWVDALTNYITAAGFPDEANPRWAKWPADVHVIGKDITRFHAVFWPAFLLSAGVALPKRIFSHGHVLYRGEKMSKSLGNTVDPLDLVTAFGLDPVRYFFLREVSFGQDGSYSHEAIVARMNADLANGLGNLAQRSLSMIAKNFDGVVPTPGPFTPEDLAMLAAADGMYVKARTAMDTQAIKVWLDTAWAVIGDGDRYFASEKPFDKGHSLERKGTILYVTAEVVRQLAILAQPAMPASAGKVLDLLAQPTDARAFASLGASGRLQAGLTLPAPVGVFPRYVEPESTAAPAEPVLSKRAQKRAAEEAKAKADKPS